MVIVLTNSSTCKDRYVHIKYAIHVYKVTCTGERSLADVQPCISFYTDKYLHPFHAKRGVLNNPKCHNVCCILSIRAGMLCNAILSPYVVHLHNRLRLSYVYPIYMFGHQQKTWTPYWMPHPRVYNTVVIRIMFFWNHVCYANRSDYKQPVNTAYTVYVYKARGTFPIRMNVTVT